MVEDSSVKVRTWFNHLNGNGPINLDFAMDYVRTGDSLLYIFQPDAFVNPNLAFASAEFLGKGNIESGVRPTRCGVPQIRVVSQDAYRVKLLTHYITEQENNFQAGTILLAEGKDLYWDEKIPIPSDRLRDVVMSRLRHYAEQSRA